MKKIYLPFIALMALLFAVSCQMQEPGSGKLTGEVDFSISAGIPGEITTYSPEVRTAFSHNGGANNVNENDYDLRYILEIYDGDAVAYRDEKVVKENFTAEGVTFNARLLAKKYDVVLWADFVKEVEADVQASDLYYATSALKNIQYTSEVSITPEILVTDAADAYYTSFEMNLTESSQSKKDVKLRRPFGKMRFIATDKLSAGVNQSERPASVIMDFGGAEVPSSFNALTGEASGSLAIGQLAFTAVQENAWVKEETKSGAYLLGYAYFFASNSSSSAYPVDITVFSDESTTNQIGKRSVSSVPVQENKLTTVIGNFYTNDGSIDVIVEDKFGEEETHNLPETVEVESLTAAQDYIKNFATDPSSAEKDVVITISEKLAEGDNGDKLELPQLSNNVTLVLENGISDSGLTIEDVLISSGSGNDFTGKLILKNNSTDPQGALEINLPAGSCEINGGNYSSITATTADNTFVLGVDAVVDTLTVNKGNVKLYGIIETAFTNNGTGTVYRCLSNDKSLQNLLNDNISGYTEILIEEEADIDGSRLGETKPVLNKPVRIMNDAVVACFDVHVLAETGSPVTVEDGAHNVILKDMKLSTENEYSILKVTGDHAKVRAENCEIILTQGKSDQSGVNVQNGGTANVIDVALDGCYIGFADYQNRVNQTYTEDYDYPSDFKWSPYSRGITVGKNSNKVYDGSSRTDLHVRNTYIEGAYYSINSLHNVELNVDVENSVFDGRAGLNIWSTSEKHADFRIKNSKFIGRNGFSGPTESFATIVINNQNNNDDGRWVKNVNIVIEASDIVSDNDPQTETNRQYMADIRTKYPCSIEFRNGTKLREIKNPRLDYFVDIEYWNSVVEDDGTTVLIGKEGVELIRTNVWNGTNVASPVPASDGKVYVGTPEILAGMVYLGFEGEAVLVRDLDLNGKPWPVADDNKTVRGTFDGRGHRVMNLLCETYAEDGQYACDNKTQNAGLFGVFSGTLINLTLEGAKVYGSRSGCLVGRFDGGTIRNCNVIGSDVLGGFQKLGILAGYVSCYSETLIEDCTVSDSYVHREDRQEGANSTQCGGLVGYLQPLGQNVVLRNNIIQNVTVESGKQWDMEDQSASHCFVGNVINSSKNTEARIEFSGNRIINCTLDADKHSNATEYFGFYLKKALDGEYLNTVIVDGKSIIK